MTEKRAGDAAMEKMKIRKREFSVRELVITVCCALAALLCAGRIFLLLRQAGSVYTMGIFPLALLFGLYCLWKKALFFKEVFFSVFVRILLAAGFTALQVLGLFWSHAGIGSVPEAFVWTVCLTPPAFAGQNMLFSLVQRADKESGAAGKTVKTAFGRSGADVGQAVGKRSFFGAFALIFGGFCIPFATYYPAIMAYDVIPQLDQIRVSGLTTHHPLIHTLLLKGCLAAGECLPFFSNADRAGLAIYSLLQMAAVAGCFAWVYTFLRRHGVNKWLCYAFVLCAAFFPTHGMLAVSITKDTIYAALVMVFTAFVYELAEKEACPQKRWLACYILLSAVLLLFRNNSVYAWILYVAVFTLATGKRRHFFGRLLACHGAALFLFLLANGLMVQAVRATSDTYAREMLSVPAQQIARVVQYHGEELTTQDLTTLGEVWEEELPEYEPAIADRSKRDIAGDQDTLRYFAKAWISLGLRYPGEYAKAFMLKNKGIWDLTDTTYLNDIYSYAKGYLQITYPSDQQVYMDALAPGYERHQKLQIFQSLYRYFAAGDELWRYCPPMALLMQPAFYTFLLLFYCLCCIGLKRPTLLLPAVFSLALLGTLLFGPCVLTRYMYPLMLSVTVMALLLFGRTKSTFYNGRS